MKETYQLFVGTYSRPIRFGTGEILEGRGKGIHRYTFDAKTGTLYESTAPAPAENPSYLALSFDKQYLYAVNELKEYKNKAGGAVSAYRIESDGGLRFLNQRPTGGADPCYVGLDRERRCLTVANFTGGSVCSYPLCADGSLGKKGVIIRHYGHGADPVRQSAPHPHAAVWAPDGKYVIVADLGTDDLTVYRVDRENRVLCADAVHSFFVGSRMGPRACVFDQRGERCYVLCEISSAVMTFSYMDGRLEFLQAVPSVAEPGGVPNSGADLHLAPDGRFLYVSNRGQDSITVFSVQADGTLQLVQAVGCGGRTPRNFALDPTGGWVLVGNQDSDSIAVFKRDVQSGRLALENKAFAPTPVSLLFRGIGRRSLYSKNKAESNAPALLSALFLYAITAENILRWVIISITRTI